MDPDHTTNILVLLHRSVQEEGGLVVFYVMYVIQIVVCGGRKLA